MSIFTKSNLSRVLALALSTMFGAQSVMAQWSQSSGIAGNVYTVVGNDTMLWAGSDTGGVYRSSNNGMSFSQVNNGLSVKSVKALTRRGGRLIAATVNLGGAFFISDNNGDNWAPPASNYFGYVFSMKQSGSDIYAGTWYGVTKSSNGGNSWASLGVSGMPSNSSVASVALINQNIFIGITTSGGSGTGVYMSDNGGNSWTAKNNGLSNTMVTALIAKGSELYAGTPTGVYRSINMGSNWTQITTGLTSPAILSLQEINGKVIAGTTDGLFVLYGDSWTNISGNLASGTQVFAITLNSGAVVIGTNKGVWATPVSILSVAKNPDNSLLVYPNPSNGIFKVEVPAEFRNVEMSIKNTLGQEVLRNSYTDLKMLEINLSNFEKGVYFIQLSSNERSFSKKIVIE